MKISIISFSGRRGGNCESILDFLEKKLSKVNEVKCIRQLDLNPCGRCNYECFEQRTKCPFLDDDTVGVYDLICDSELAYYVVPNYCDYPNAYFFMFNERGQCYFQGHEDLLQKYRGIRKKFVIVSNTGVENFNKAFMYHVSDNAEANILCLSAKRFNKRSITGDLLDSPEARRILAAFMNP